MALALDDLLKSFSSPALGLVYPGPLGVGVNGALFDALMAEPHLALEARRKGARVAVPGVIDSPESRIILDRICEDDSAMQQAAAILSGETGDIVIRCHILLHLLRHVSALPVGGVAAITAPADMRHRAEVAQYLANRIAAGQLSAYEIDGLHRIEHGTYQDFPGRLPGSMFLDAWVGALTVFSE